MDGGAGLLGIPEPLGLGFTKPVLIMSGDVIEGPGQPEIRRAPRSFFDKLTHLDAYWMRVVGTVHGDFAFYPWFYSPTTTAKTQAAVAMRDYPRSFFNKYLRDQDDHLMDRPSPAYPAANPFLRSDPHSPHPAPEPERQARLQRHARRHREQPVTDSVSMAVQRR